MHKTGHLLITDNSKQQVSVAPRVHRYTAEGKRPRAAMLVLPALGVTASYYAPLAEALAGLGLEIGVLELRGQGDSPLRASWRVDFGFRELLEEDVPAAVRQLREAAPDVPLLLLGHSLGGHLAAMTAGRESAGEIDGVMLVACSSPWLPGYDRRTRRQLRLLRALVYLSISTLGYYPGHRLGFGGREARTLMRDWLVLMRNNRYRAAGLAEDLDAAVGRYTGPVLAVRMAEDSYAPEAAMEAVLGKFQSALLTREVIDSATLGTRADHFRWIRQPGALVQRITLWLDESRLHQH